MSTFLLDGGARTTDLPEEIRVMLDDLCPRVCDEALDLARRARRPLGELVACILSDTSGVALLTVSVGDFFRKHLPLEELTEERRERIEAFLLEEHPATQIRLIVVTPIGVALLGLSPAPMQPGGTA